MFTVPFTRGSTRKLRPVISPTALTTASMSALTKFSVTVSLCCASLNVVVDSSAASNTTTKAKPRRSAAAKARNRRDRVAQWPALAVRGLRRRDETTAIDAGIRAPGILVVTSSPWESAAKRIGGDNSIGIGKDDKRRGRRTLNPAGTVAASNRLQVRGAFMQHWSSPGTADIRRLVLGTAFAIGIAIAMAPQMGSVRAADLHVRIAQTEAPAAPNAGVDAPPPAKAAPKADGAKANADRNDAADDSDTADDEDASKGSITADRHGIVIDKGGKHIRIEGLGRDREYDSFQQFVQDAPWLAGLVFLSTLLV